MDKKQLLYIVTGATGSIGKEIALRLAKDNYNVILACRNVENSQKVRQGLIDSTGNSNIECMELDLASFEAVLKFVAQVKALNTPIGGLFNNAGIKCKIFSTTIDGYETSFQVNFLSTILLTLALYPIIEPNGKVIFTTSITRKLYNAKKISFNSNSDTFSQLADYAKSKLAITHYALHLAENPKNIIVNCADPGIVDSNMITMNRWFDSLANYIFRPFISSPAKGAQAALRAFEASDSKHIFTQGNCRDISRSWEKDTNHYRLISNANAIISKCGVSPTF